MKIKVVVFFCFASILLASFQNCSMNSLDVIKSSDFSSGVSSNGEPQTFGAQLGADLAARLVGADPRKYMVNQLTHTGEGKVNPAYGKQIKNIIIYQPGGWSGLMLDKREGVDFPLTGKENYMRRTDAILLAQMDLIKGLGDSVAIAVLMMDDADSRASGYGTCWNGYWVADFKCSPGGQWLYPTQMYQKIRWAAWMKGIPVIPNFSIMNYATKGQGDKMLGKLKSMTDWGMKFKDLTSAINKNGQMMIIVDSLADTHGMNLAQRQAVLDYMSSRKDIIWVDNLVADETLKSLAGDNIIRSTAYFDKNEAVQGATVEWIKSVWGKSFLYWFSTGWGRTIMDVSDPANNVPHNVRERWMNINPYSADNYPVIISQWNEYAEGLIFEPSIYRQKSSYDYLKWMISRQK